MKNKIRFQWPKIMNLMVGPIGQNYSPSEFGFDSANFWLWLAIFDFGLLFMTTPLELTDFDLWTQSKVVLGRSDQVVILREGRWDPTGVDFDTIADKLSARIARPRAGSWSQIFADIVRCEQRMLLNKLYSYLALSTTLDYVQKIIPIIIIDTALKTPASLSPKFHL